MNLIVAVDSNWAIGNKNELLIRIPNDMKHFREETAGNVVVLGRKTLETFPQGLPLKNRTNIILSKDKNYKVKDAIVVHSIEELMEELKKYDDIEIIVVGNPINMDGTRGLRSEKAAAFAAKLSKATGIETVLYDERLSTMNAHRIMNDTNTRGQKRKDTVDTLSAQLILQSYMDLNKKR